MDIPTIRGVYASSSALAAQPDLIDRLVNEMGVNLLILTGPVALPEHVRARNPLPARVADRMSPGTGLTTDDRPLRALIEQAHRRGLHVWLLLSGWWDDARHGPDLAAVDLWGLSLLAAPLSRYSTEHRMGPPYCPSSKKLQDWFALLYQTVAQEYEVDGLDLTHVRFTHPAFFRGLWACGCGDCQRMAADLDYNLPQVAQAARTFVAGIGQWTPALISAIVEGRLSPLEQWEALGITPDLQKWFRFRMDLTTTLLSTLRQQVKDAVDRPLMFLSDTHVPTFAPLVGHRYQDWAQCSDAISPLLCHFVSHYLDNFASLATEIMTRSPQIDEAMCLRLVYQIFGYRRFGLPVEIDALSTDNVARAAQTLPLEDMVAHELRQARVLTPPGLPSYPVLHAGQWPADVARRLAEQALAMGHDGLIFQGTAAYTGDNLPIW